MGFVSVFGVLVIAISDNHDVIKESTKLLNKIVLLLSHELTAAERISYVYSSSHVSGDHEVWTYCAD